MASRKKAWNDPGARQTIEELQTQSNPLRVTTPKEGAQKQTEDTTATGGVERFEFKKYSHIFYAGAAGGSLFICYPLLKGASGTFAAIVGGQSSMLVLLFLIFSGGMLGGFLALISKQNRLWPAFVMGLSFNSVLASVIPEDINDKSEQPKVEIHDSSDELTLPPQTQNANWSIFPSAFANESCATPLASRAKQFFSLNHCPSLDDLEHILSQSAEEHHLSILKQAFRNQPGKTILIRTTGEYPESIIVQVHFGSQRTNFRPIDGHVVVPYLGQATKVVVFGDSRLEPAETKLPPKAQTLSISLNMDFKKAALSALKKSSGQKLIKVTEWDVTVGK